MQSGTKKFDKWIIEFITENPGMNPLMGWESSSDTYSEINLEFKTKELAIEYAKKNKIDYEIKAVVGILRFSLLLYLLFRFLNLIIQLEYQHYISVRLSRSPSYLNQLLQLYQYS